MKNIFAGLFAKGRVGNVGHDEAGSPRESTFKRGDVIGGEYEIHRLLGEGGFGEVYLALPRIGYPLCAENDSH